MTISDLLCFGGDKGNRTPDLMNANHALSRKGGLHTPKNSRDFIESGIIFPIDTR